MQLREQILRAASRGALHAGEQLPTVREVAIALRINPNTVNRAYIELEREGVLATKRGRGTFLADIPAADHRASRTRLLQIVRRCVSEAAALGFSGAQIQGALSTELKKLQ